MLPEFLLKELKKEYGEEQTLKIVEGYSKKRPTTFRVNTIKSSEEKIRISF